MNNTELELGISSHEFSTLFIVPRWEWVGDFTDVGWSSDVGFESFGKSSGMFILGYIVSEERQKVPLHDMDNEYGINPVD